MTNLVNGQTWVEVWQRNFLIPDYMRPGFQRYVDDHILPGSFLTAVLMNNFMEACAQADVNNELCLRAYAKLLYNEVPSSCYGSPNEVMAWVAKGRREDDEKPV